VSFFFTETFISCSVALLHWLAGCSRRQPVGAVGRLGLVEPYVRSLIHCPEQHEIVYSDWHLQVAAFGFETCQRPPPPTTSVQARQ
jgi:hypothetical protein